MSTAPKRITYHKEAAELELGWADGTNHRLSAEYLRVHSPSAEVRGHGVGQEVLQVGKRYVTITGIEPTGRYAIKITFDDGHDSGLYDWAYLRKLGDDQETYWQTYLDRLTKAGASREPQFIQAKQL